MYKLIKFLISINCDEKKTYYFFNKETQFILPVETPNSRNTFASLYPTTIDTLRRTINALGSRVTKVKIYFNTEDIYYTYLTLNKEDIEIEINSNFCDAVETALLFDAPVYVTEDILKDKGFRVTKELIERSLT